MEDQRSGVRRSAQFLLSFRSGACARFLSSVDESDRGGTTGGTDSRHSRNSFCNRRRTPKTTCPRKTPRDFRWSARLQRSAESQNYRSYPERKLCHRKGEFRESTRLLCHRESLPAQPAWSLSCGPSSIRAYARRETGGTETRSESGFKRFCGIDFRSCWTRRKGADLRDRKSTRLNSSHGYISYAVFCLQKKKRY